MNIKNILCCAFACTALFLTSCGSHKAVEGSQVPSTTTTTPKKDAITNVTAKLDITVNDGSHEMTVDGKLQMRKDAVIRVLITPFGVMEAGRLEFTPEYVLIMDRMNKQYVKERYEDVDMLKKNGITFKTVQEHFWNEYKKQFITLSLDKMRLNIKVNKVSNNGDFDDQTSIASKYEKVSLQEVMKKLASMAN